MLGLLLALSANAATPSLDPVVLVLQGSTTCAGAFVDETGRVATAYHCVAAGGRPKVETRDGRTGIGRVVAVDARADLAVLEVPELAGTAHFEVRAEPPVLGEDAWALGHPYGSRTPTGFMEGTLRWSASLGVVSAYGPVSVQITAPVNPGNSGGPVVDADGRLIGVVSRRLSGDGLGFAARADRLRALLDDPRRMGPLGGTFGGEIFTETWGGDGGTVAVGFRLEAAFRDRVFAAVSGASALQPRWDAVRFGDVAWIGSEVRGGLRLRVLRGVTTLRLDGWGGAAGLQTRIGEADLDITSSVETLPTAGATVAFPGFGMAFDLGWAWTADGAIPRAAFVFTWPGVVWIF